VTERLHARTAQLVCDGTIISVGGIADEIAPKVPNDNTFQSEFARLSVRRGWLVRYYLENWIDHDGDLPLLHGTLIRLEVDHLPGERDPKPLWLWSSRTGASPGR
jgi:hypothetical protein